VLLGPQPGPFRADPEARSDCPIGCKDPVGQRLPGVIDPLRPAYMLACYKHVDPDDGTECGPFPFGAEQT
jgi:hypothetical protein